MTTVALTSAISFHRRLFFGQLVNLAIVALAALGILVIGWFSPNFFEYPYFKWGGWASVWKFWPLFAWGIGVNLAIWLMSDSDKTYASDNRELFGWEALTSVLAGVWEELAYRWAFICYAMLFLAALNWAFGMGLGLVMTILWMAAAVALWTAKRPLYALYCGALAAVTFWAFLHVNPVYWLYQLMTLIVHYTTFTLMDPVLYGERDSLMVYGAILANTWFRDGHKYQGWFGLVNSWYAGMALLYATVMYGLVTAIVVHALYDLAISVFRFATQKTQ